MKCNHLYYSPIRIGEGMKKEGRLLMKHNTIRYRRTRLTATQWEVVGLCINWESLLTAYAISGLVNERYCRLPITRQYSVVSSRVVPSWRERKVLVDSGVVTSLVVSIFMHANKSCIYRCWDSSMPEEV